MCSNVYLTQVLNRYKSFGGVFACDELRTIDHSSKKILSIIVNTETAASEISGHWMLITFFNKNKTLVKCEVFDSLAQHKSHLPPMIQDYIRLLKSPVKYSTTQIQSNFSDFCGLFCIARFMSILLNEGLNTFTSNFTTRNLEQNNETSVNLISRYIKVLNV